MKSVSFRGVAGRSALALLAAAVTAGAAAPAAAQVSCGETIADGRYVVLQGDVECAGGASIRVEGPATLDLNGFTVRCASGAPPAPGVLLAGSGASLRNGAVAGCGQGVVLEGEGRHAVASVVVSSSGSTGVVVRSHRNHVADSVVVDSGARGFVVSGMANRLTNNVAARNGAVGFFVVKRNTLRANVANEHDEAGFIVASSFSTLVDNRASAAPVGFYVRGQSNRLQGNRGEGNITGVLLDEESRGNVVVANVMRDNLFTGFFGHGGSGNKLVENRSENNGGHGVILLGTASRTVVHGTVAASNGATDLLDEAPGCGSNRWRGNVFATSNQGCIQ